MRRLFALAGFGTVVAALVLPSGGDATVPGPNGVIVFVPASRTVRSPRSGLTDRAKVSGRKNRGVEERLPWFVYAIPIALIAFIVVYAIVASWISW